MARMGGRASSGTIAIVVLLCSSLVLSCQAVGKGSRRPPRGRPPVGAPRVGEKIFNIMQFGAKPDGKADSTQAFMRAWVGACGFPGNARVVVPAGIFKASGLIFGGPCKGPSPIFEIMGTVKADSDLSNYPDPGWIIFEHVNGLVLIGGVIDGQGPNVWKYNNCKGNSGSCSHLPASLYMNDVNNARILRTRLVNSMGFHMHITNSNNVRINKLVITAPGDSPNTDGIHISKSRFVKVVGTVIGTGDDCISLGQGATDTTVHRVTCGPGHGISVGSLGKLPKELDVRGVTVTNCTLRGTTNGLRIKTWPASDPSAAAGMLFSDIIMNNVKNPIIIDQNYGGKKSQASRVKISDVNFRNIRGTSSSPVAVSLVCSNLVPCERLNFNNVNLRLNGPNLGPKGPNLALSSVCTNARAGVTGLQIPPLACK